MIEQGDVYIPDQAQWLAGFLNELLGFPNAKHDDRVDAFSQLLNWVRKSRGIHKKEASIPGFGSKVFLNGVEYRPPQKPPSMSNLFGKVIKPDPW